MSTKLNRTIRSLVQILLLQTSVLSAQTWTQTSAPHLAWDSAACSANGSNWVAAASKEAPGPIYRSTDGGVTWQPTSAPSNYWSSVASSADGVRLVAASTTGQIYTSADSGASWIPSPVPGYLHWSSVACSADGLRVVAVADSPIYTSTDAGTNWSETGIGYGLFVKVACSGDGTALVAVHYLRYVLTSRDFGATWRLTPLNGPICVASSADGVRLVAAGAGYSVYTSGDGGEHWTLTSCPRLDWTSVASSADGSRLAAVVGYTNSLIVTSPDAGATWITNNAPDIPWRSVASSADGCKLMAGSSTNGIYTSQTIPRPVLSASRSAGGVMLSWLVPSITFALQENADLSTDNWTDLPITPTLNYTNIHYEVTLGNPTGNRFYRLASK